MKYTVTWTRAALDELALMWSQSEDRAAVASASNEVDRLLAFSPHSQGESRGGNARVTFVRPIGVDYEILDDDRTVRVLTVWRVKRA
jgi:hypothetical protein